MFKLCSNLWLTSDTLIYEDNKKASFSQGLKNYIKIWATRHHSHDNFQFQPNQGKCLLYYFSRPAIANRYGLDA